MISTRLAVICLTLPMTAALSAQSLGDVARKAHEDRDKARTTAAKTYTNQTLTPDPNVPTVPGATPLPAGQSGKQFVTLFDVRLVGNSGGAVQSMVISGRGYAGIPEERRRAGVNSEAGDDEFAEVTVADARDPLLPSCLNLLIADVFMEHTVQISGTGHFEPRAPAERPRPVSLRLDSLSACTAVPRR